MKKKKDRHHRFPTCCGGTDVPSNISWVNIKQHRAYHMLFGHGGDVRRTAKLLNDHWIDPRYKLVVVELVKPEDPNQLKLELEE